MSWRGVAGLYTLNAMLRFIALIAGIAFGFESSTGAEFVSETDLIGTWKIEPSTFTVRDLAIPNTNPRPQLPANYNAFAVVLKKDGSFIATNVPAKLFFDWPATQSCSGEWYARTNSLVDGSTHKTNTYLRVGLWFHSPSPGLWGRPTTYWSKSSSARRTLALHVGPVKDASNTYEWNLLLTKQDQVRSPRL